MRLIIHGRQPLTRRDDAIQWLLYPELHAGSHGFALMVKYCFSYKGSGALLLEASLSQDMDLINASTLVAVCRRGNPNAGGCRPHLPQDAHSSCTGRAERSRGCVREIRWSDPRQLSRASHIMLWVADYDD